MSTALNDTRWAVIALVGAYWALIVLEARRKARAEALADAQWRIFVRDHGLTERSDA